MPRGYKSGMKINLRGCLAAALALGLVSCAQSRLPAPVLDDSVVAYEQDWEHPPKYYVVKKGETLFSISMRSKHKYQELALLNNIEPPYRLYEGQVIKLEY
ncbi:LysM peptidoglycan-binding domain-containing protein [Candidatus Methylobacter oryzae]|nr:LysM domain-containing protein [Candidatus Methylobacter oryzae]